jgi:hypothetical protein
MQGSTYRSLLLPQTAERAKGEARERASAKF